ncbi:MAG: prephenate dehydrogenase/arogenate dehydrogenase family protein [Verrucomicrobiota bacterium]
MSVKPEEFRSVAILGPGLLGGSLLKCLSEQTPEVDLRVWARRQQAVDEIGLLAPSAKASSSLEELIAGAELIVLAMPVEHMRSVVDGISCFAPGAIVTDVGSVKESVHQDLDQVVKSKGGIFVGSHPMAGSEKTGIEHSTADLFRGAAVVVTSDSDEQEEHATRVSTFWQNFGCNVIRCQPAQHDRWVAAVSHLPHLMASALVRSTLHGNEGQNAAQLIAGGFTDTTRVASGAPAMWAGILEANHDGMIDELQAWREALVVLDKDALHRFLSEAKEMRDAVIS